MNVLTKSELLERYESMLHLSQQMLAAAKAQEWDLLTEMEASRTSLIDELRQHDTLTWTAESAEKKRALILAILSSDDELRPLAELQRQELRKLIDSANTDRKLKKTYDTP